MKWEKLGVLYCPNANDEMQYASLPVVDVIDEKKGLIRIYYTQRDKNNYGFPTFLEGTLKEDRFHIIKNEHEPLIERNAAGTFDDSGVNITSYVDVDENERRFYYLGWNLGVTVPFRNSVGVAVTVDKNKLKMKRVFRGPILDRNKNNPFSVTTPFVIKEKGLYKMWFCCGEDWIINKDGSKEVACHIQYAESLDGYDWIRHGDIAINHLPTDHVTTSPFVIKEDGIYKMWYSYRGEKYRIGYAESIDGKNFVRKDEEAGITVSESGWDSEAVCYPCIFDLNGERYMVYCGNGYGESGMGLAKLEK